MTVVPAMEVVASVTEVVLPAMERPGRPRHVEFGKQPTDSMMPGVPQGHRN
jgi:hypothetical protein